MTLSDKMICPGCDAYSSSVLADYRDGKPCRLCGLPHESAVAIKVARASTADKTLIEQFEAATIRATKAEQAVFEYRRVVEDIRRLVAGLGGE